MGKVMGFVGLCEGAYHVQTNGQRNVVNISLRNLL
jgi:hypothetical protein